MATDLWIMARATHPTFKTSSYYKKGGGGEISYIEMPAIIMHSNM